MNFGDSFRTIESSEYSMMTDSKRRFLQSHLIISHPDDPSVWQRLMVFGNPSLFGLLQASSVDLYIDATFDCCPHPFYQCLIIMVFDRMTSCYVPVLYILMTHKTQELYWHAMQAVIVISEWRLNVRSYTTDFERAIINSCQHQFAPGFHVGCFFHLKQAWRRQLISKLGFLKEQLRVPMSSGVLDLLTVLPQDEVESIGIPYVRSVIEENADAATIQKWDRFWDYFESTWLPILDNWDISLAEDDYKDLINRTNNGIESYNKRHSGLFDGDKPTLLEFAKTTEKEG